MNATIVRPSFGNGFNLPKKLQRLGMSTSLAKVSTFAPGFLTSKTPRWKGLSLSAEEKLQLYAYEKQA